MAKRATKPASQKSTRDRILDAAARILARQGMGATTTKRIAAEARLSEGSLYNHFKDRADLLIALVLERLPSIRQVFVELHNDAVPLPERLPKALAAMIAFYLRTQPFVAGIVSDPALLKLTRKRFDDSGQGPHLAHEKLAALLRAEQTRGHIRAGVSPEMIAALLIGACTEYASLYTMTGSKLGGLGSEDYAASIIATLAPAIFPGGAATA